MISSEILSGLLGLVMPYIVEIVMVKLPKTKGRWLGYVLAYGVSILIGAGTSYFEGSFDPENVLASAGSALIVSQGVYNLYFKPKKQDKAIQKALQ